MYFSQLPVGLVISKWHNLMYQCQQIQLWNLRDLQDLLDLLDHLDHPSRQKQLLA